ncbi:permease [Deinococcus radiopugnans]|uniref:Permease n=1 Tax=Deinococcus radiopugnans TaxID=57497 RepID=A0A0A7KHU0_9DEIO|nr:LptF/LptG family permease [Deinococcus radiopugnans]AIZ45747.1 permease [Deinococcus radiopugnans]QLG11523.1 YjgP/YjgQ family permease [Deinococcus sp. D7000]
MPILTRTVLGEIARWYLGGVALFLTLLMTDALSSTVGKLLVYHPPVTQALAAFLSILPQSLNKTLVLAVPFSILLAFSRMQRDNELKAVLASGIRPLSLVWPLALPFALVGVVAYFNAGTLVPAGLANWDRAWYTIYDQPPPPPQQEKYIYAPPGALYYAGRVSADSAGSLVAQLSGVMVQRGDETLTAQYGTWDSGQRTWTLNSPWITRPGQNPRQEGGDVVVPQTDTLRPPPPAAQQVSNAELRAALLSDTLSRKGVRDYTFQLAARVADPATPVVFALAAGMLGLLIRNRAAAFAAVLVFIVCFYILWTTMPGLAGAGALNPTLAAWVPNLAFLLLAGGLAWRLR